MKHTREYYASAKEMYHSMKGKRERKRASWWSRWRLRKLMTSWNENSSSNYSKVFCFCSEMDPLDQAMIRDHDLTPSSSTKVHVKILNRKGAYGKPTFSPHICLYWSSKMLTRLINWEEGYKEIHHIRIVRGALYSFPFSSRKTWIYSGEQMSWRSGSLKKS